MLKRLFALLLFSPILLLAQSGLHIKRAEGKIVLDAIMNEPDWEKAEVAGNFMQYFPQDTSGALAPTEVRVTYDDQFIYIVAKMKNGGPREYVTPSLRRDFRGEANDAIIIVFDTFLDKTNAFSFGVNPFGVQREGLIANGGLNGGNDFTLSWDNKWYSEVKQYEDYWMAEMAIPFKTLRFKESLSKWNVNFYRIDSHYAERSTWSPIPRNFDIVTLAFNRELLWDEPLKNPGTNISIIPYGTLRSTRDFEEGTPTNHDRDLGGDAKIAVGPALNLDLTINPDFSQVEVDQQVTNLDRFEIFFPERRQFFLENADLFANFGSSSASPFFSRRIGVARDTSTGQNIQNPIYFGARLSGKIDNNWRIGFLSIQAGKDPKINLPSTNYTVATLQRKIFTRSNISLIALNKQAFQDSIGGDFSISPSLYNRLLGIDFNLATSDNAWNGKFFYHHSFDQDKLDSSFAMGASLEYNIPQLSVETVVRNIGANYNPEVGFVRRKDFMQWASTAWYNFYPSSRIVQSHGPGFDFDMIGNKTFGFLDWDVNLLYRIRFKNTSFLSIRPRREYTYLFNDFDPSGTGGLELPDSTSYANWVIIASYTSDARKKFSFEASTRSGGYFNGSRINLVGRIGYRFQPFGVISVDFSFNRIRLPQPYNNADHILIGPRFDLTLSRSVFWTTFIQYNSQIDNLNINSRFQWRFKPVSDLFIVYTDNYFAETDSQGPVFYIGKPKLRALVIKLTYWLNL